MWHGSHPDEGQHVSVCCWQGCPSPQQVICLVTTAGSAGQSPVDHGKHMRIGVPHVVVPAVVVPAVVVLAVVVPAVVVPAVVVLPPLLTDPPAPTPPPKPVRIVSPSQHPSTAGPASDAAP